MNRTTSVVLGEMGAFVARMVESGRYGNVSEVLRDALRRLEADELRRQRFVAYLESLPLVEPDAWDLEILSTFGPEDAEDDSRVTTGEMLESVGGGL